MKGFVLRILTPRPDFVATMTDDERATMAEHARYWAELAVQGHVLAFGPVDDPDGPYGIAIVLAADQEEAERLRDGDPALASAHGFRTELAPMLVLVTPEARYDAR
jgi:hypothetical protein